MMEGSGSGAVPLPNGFGCGSGRSINHTDLDLNRCKFSKMFFFVLLLLVVRISQAVSSFSYRNQKWNRLGNLTCRVLVGRVLTNTVHIGTVSQRACVYSVDCLSGPGPEVGRGDGLRWVEPYLAVYNACVAATAHPGVDISVMDYLGKSIVLPHPLFYSLFIAVEPDFDPFGFGTSVLVESGFGIIFPDPRQLLM
jgi:hypothetical protein